jgi:hypothetical protein
MKVSELLDENKIYAKVEEEIRAWMKVKYNGVYDIEFHNEPTYLDGKRLPDTEIVQCMPVVSQSKKAATKVVAEVNEKIDEILQSHDEEIYISGLLARIYVRHPNFKSAKCESIAELKKNKLFLQYMKELRMPRMKKEIKP